MAQPMPTQSPQRPFSPYENDQSPSPTTNDSGINLPPAKKPRLSPHLPSPSSNLSNTSGGNASPSSTSQPALALPRPHLLPTPSFHQPQPMNGIPMPMQQTAQGLMPPPQRPAAVGDQIEKPDKATDLATLNDVLASGGIDEREEETYLANTYRNQHTSFSTSFGSQTTKAMSPGTSFGQFSQGSGPASQAPITQQRFEDEVFKKHREAARELAQKQQHHLNDPFLQTNVLRTKLVNSTYRNQVQLNTEGLQGPLRAPKSHPQDVSGVTTPVQEGSPSIASIKTTLLDNSPLVDIFALLSLATNERLRNTLEDAYTLSRGRRYGTHGVVPPEWSDLAVGNNPRPTTTDPKSLTNSAWDQPPESAGSPGAQSLAKRSKATSDEPLSSRSKPPPPTILPTTTFTDPAAATLRAAVERDKKAEQERLQARAERQKRAAQAADSSSSAGGRNGTTTPAAVSTPGGTPAPTNGPLAEKAPEKPMTKKERDKLAKAGIDDATTHRNANATASLALGGFKKKKYSWMQQGGGSGTSTPKANNIARIGARGSGQGEGGSGVGGLGAGADSSTPEARVIGKEKRWGEWREDGERGSRVQIRDVVNVLEDDVRARKTLQIILSRLNSKDTAGAEANADLAVGARRASAHFGPNSANANT